MHPIEPFLKLSRISKSFVSDDGETTPVIDNVSMDVSVGEFVVFLGPSGCGKTTLMRIVGGLETSNDGEVFLSGEKVTGPDRKKGMVFQAYTSFPWLTVLDNIRFGTRYRNDIGKMEKEAVADHYLQLVSLKEFSNYYVNRISGGMRQRVAIARTLAANPDVLLMDEPFGALDAQTREFLQGQLLEINKRERKTTIFVTHDVDESIVLADRIFIFSARPASVIEIIQVSQHITGERDISVTETQSFFELRNHIRDLMRDQARRTQELAEQEIIHGVEGGRV
ncbi:MAG TPA: ABC transporter ATP-binding protein [Alphaproteobacteria bacterium]|jgi:NitT/TauT family transport system ATP-binding protein|nr:ABC transporter ATP-binding protein [Alphaproteobacteria bacterium]HIO01673.1 ABC transporter ATP-binding protein [Alphaproteobacteria bacterium]